MSGNRNEHVCGFAAAAGGPLFPNWPNWSHCAFGHFSIPLTIQSIYTGKCLVKACGIETGALLDVHKQSPAEQFKLGYLRL